MSSSISSSEMPAEVLAWKQWIAIFVAWLVLGFGGLYSFVLFLDPYDTGQFAVVKITGIVDESPRTAVASRARDARFDAAIVGNSTGQLLAPKQLSELTGSHFVQLTMPGTGPREQFVTMHWFARHHPRISALVIVTDETWCTQDPPCPYSIRFHFGCTRTACLNILAVYSRGKRSTVHSGAFYWRWGCVRRPNPVAMSITRRGGLEFSSRSHRTAGGFATPAFRFRTIVPCRRQIARLNARSAGNAGRVRHAPRILHAHSAAGQRCGSSCWRCKAGLAAAVADRPRSGFLDFLINNAVTRDPENFMDYKHYRAAIAREMEAQIAARLRSGRADQHR